MDDSSYETCVGNNHNGCGQFWMISIVDCKNPVMKPGAKTVMLS